MFRHLEFMRRRAIGTLADVLFAGWWGWRREFVFEMTRAEVCRSNFWMGDQVRNNYFDMANRIPISIELIEI